MFTGVVSSDKMLTEHYISDWKVYPYLCIHLEYNFIQMKNKYGESSNCQTVVYQNSDWKI